MVGQPVTGDRSRTVQIGPGIGQYAPPMKLLVVGSPPGRGHGVPAEDPDVLVPDQQWFGAGQAVRGCVQCFFRLQDLPLQDPRQLAGRSKRLVEQGVDDKRDAHVTLSGFRPHGRHQVHHRHNRGTTDKSRAHPWAWLLDDHGRPVSKHDHVPVHAVHA